MATSDLKNFTRDEDLIGYNFARILRLIAKVLLDWCTRGDNVRQPKGEITLLVEEKCNTEKSHKSVVDKSRESKDPSLINQQLNILKKPQVPGNGDFFRDVIHALACIIPIIIFIAVISIIIWTNGGILNIFLSN